VTDVVQIGDVVPVMLKEIDDKGRYNLSIKAADPEYASKKGVTPGTGSRDEHGGNERHGRRDDKRHRI
jgi:predicted RNA-binding protein with RPS1 domain